jgi:hypothetical protein
MTDNWINLTGEREVVPPVELDFGELQQDFIQTRPWEEEVDRIFNDHLKIIIYYEQLSGNYTRGMESIQSFHDLDPETFVPQIHKQASRPLSVTIANCAELKESFKGSPWKLFFTDKNNAHIISFTLVPLPAQ